LSKDLHKQPANDASLSHRQRLDEDFKLLSFPAGYTSNLKWDLPLDSVGKNGSRITWQSANANYISNDGKLQKRSPRNGKKIIVNFTAILSSGALAGTPEMVNHRKMNMLNGRRLISGQSLDNPNKEIMEGLLSCALLILCRGCH